MRDWDYSIRTLDLENYRRFESLHISFDDYMTVIVGNNGAGKTTLLDACAVAISSLLAKMEDSKSLSIRRSDARFITAQQGSAKIRQSQYPVRIDAEGSLNRHPYCWSREVSSGKSTMTRKGAQNIIGAGEALQRLVSSGDREVVLPVLAYYDANRFASKAAAPALSKEANSFLASRTRAYADAFDVSIDERRTLTWIRNMTLWELQSGQKSPELACVMGVFSKCYAKAADVGETSAYFDLQLQDVVIQYEAMAGDVKIETTSSMSDGYRSATLMFADIARRMAQLNPNLGPDANLAPGIVLVDEVDLHLHPRWQAHIADDLRDFFPNVQFILTTHAPIVISSVRARHLRLLGEGSVIRQDSETYGGNVARILKVVMGAEERPKEVRDRFDAFYGDLDFGKCDDAEIELDVLADLIGSNDPDVVAARTALFLERV